MIYRRLYIHHIIECVSVATLLATLIHKMRKNLQIVAQSINPQIAQRNL